MHHHKLKKFPEKMINRILLRVKIVQLFYAYLKNESKSIDLAERELLLSIEKTYTQYHFLLLLIAEITTYAQNRLESGKNKLRPSAEELNPNMRFAENKFAIQLSNNEHLKSFVKEHKLTWENYLTAIKSIYENIINSDFYLEYMNAPINNYEADRELWRKIFKRCILTNEELDIALEEQCIYWNDDIDIVVSFILKTIKRFEEATGNKQELLPMFKDDDDREFASKLYKTAILNADEYKTLIDEHTKNWEVDRIAFMDVVIMQTALAELINFPTIPINVTLNEYIEIAKKYSTERSSNFINGVLDNIVTQLKKDNKIIKAKFLSSNQK